MKEIAKLLLEVNAVKINPDVKNPFVFPSGMNSPIFCDCNRAYGAWEVNKLLVDKLTEAVDKMWDEFNPHADVTIVSVGTSAIGWGYGVTSILCTPFAYVRTEMMDCGIVQQIEGANLGSDNQVIILEDLVATGESALAAVEAVRKTGAKVVGVVAIMSFGWAKAKQAFEEANVPLVALTDYHELLQDAVKRGHFTAEETTVLESWYSAPENWGK